MRSAAVTLGLVLGACATDPMAAVEAAYASGDYEAARRELLELEADDDDNAHLYQLELGVVHQALREPKAAVEVLRKARDRMDRLESDTFADWASSVFVDDRLRTYAGADYEHVMVRALLALADLMDDGNDAFAYALQVRAKQKEIIDSFDAAGGKNPKQAYKLVAFGNYLRAIISEQDARDRSEARREFQRVVDLAPEFPNGKQDLERVTEGRFAAKGNGVVHVLAMVGRGPRRMQIRQKPSTIAIGIAQIIWSQQRGNFPTPSFVPIPIPALSFADDNPDSIAVSADGKPVGETVVLTDVEATAQAEFKAMQPYIIARAVVRRMIKATAVEVGKEIVDHNRKHKQGFEEQAKTDLIQLGIGVLGNLWAATEAADLRCWNLLPASFQVLRVELPEGAHEIQVQATRGGQPVGQARSVRVQVVGGYNTYVSAIVPSVQGGPSPMTSRPAVSTSPQQSPGPRQQDR